MKIVDQKKLKRKLQYICKTYSMPQIILDKILKAVESSMTELIDCRDTWISVKDRLPDKRDERYLCYHRYADQQSVLDDIICENVYLGSGRWLSDEDTVTHWMPMMSAPVEFEYKGE